MARSGGKKRKSTTRRDRASQLPDLGPERDLVGELGDLTPDAFEELCAKVCADTIGLQRVVRQGHTFAADRGLDVVGDWPGPAGFERAPESRWGVAVMHTSVQRPDPNRFRQVLMRGVMQEVDVLMYMTNDTLPVGLRSELCDLGQERSVRVVFFELDDFRAALRTSAKLNALHLELLHDSVTPVGDVDSRTKMIAAYSRDLLEREDVGKDYILRLQSGLSAISLSEEDWRGEGRSALRDEHETVRAIIEKGVPVRLLVCPAIDLLRLCTDRRSKQTGFGWDDRSKYYRRLDNLIRYLRNELPKLPKADCHTAITGGGICSRYIFGQELTISGHRRSGEKGYVRSQVTAQQAYIRGLCKEFDIVFADSACQLLGKPHKSRKGKTDDDEIREWKPKNAEEATKLREQVIARLENLLEFVKP